MKCSKLTGLGVYDLEDHLWHDAYLDGTTPREALTEALRDNGYLS